jgi:hypothetical protein
MHMKNVIFGFREFSQQEGEGIYVPDYERRIESTNGKPALVA